MTSIFYSSQQELRIDYQITHLKSLLKDLKKNEMEAISTMES
jgi:hypothetical protein